MTGRLFMTKDLRTLLCPPTRRAGVIQMNMGDEDMADGFFIQTFVTQTRTQIFQCRSRSCLDEYKSGRCLDHIGSNESGGVLKMQVEGMDGHGLIHNGFVFDLHTPIIQRR